MRLSQVPQAPPGSYSCSGCCSPRWVPSLPLSLLLPTLPLPYGSGSRLDRGHVSVFNKSQGGERVAPGHGALHRHPGGERRRG